MEMISNTCTPFMHRACLLFLKIPFIVVTMKTKATILLKNGSQYHGYTFSSKKPVQGELVFNTGMVGYPETLTDPSYKGQILIFTYPIIGNYGVPPHIKNDGILKYFESEKIQISGLIVNYYSDTTVILPAYDLWATGSKKKKSQLSAELTRGRSPRNYDHTAPCPQKFYSTIDMENRNSRTLTNMIW